MGKFPLLVVIALIIAFWLVANPQGKFGYSMYGLTTYNAIPIPYFDLIVNVNGKVTLIGEKDNYVNFTEMKRVLNATEETPETLIIGIGYNGLVGVDRSFFNRTFVHIDVMLTPYALKRYNKLKDEGRNVSIIVHSTS